MVASLTRNVDAGAISLNRFAEKPLPSVSCTTRDFVGTVDVGAAIARSGLIDRDTIAVVDRHPGSMIVGVAARFGVDGVDGDNSGDHTPPLDAVDLGCC